MGVISCAPEAHRASKGSSSTSSPPEGGRRWLGGWGRAVPFPHLSDHVRLILKFYTGCTLSWSCMQHNGPQGCRGRATGDEGVQVPVLVPMPCRPHFGYKCWNLVVASPSHCHLGVNAEMPVPRLWGYAQVDAGAVRALGAARCWRNPPRGGWIVLRADLHVSHSYCCFRANDLLLGIFENIGCYRKW